MADEEKLILKADVLLKYSSALDYNEDKSAFQCQELILEGKRIESLGKEIGEVAHIRKLNLKNNSIQDISGLQPFTNLVCL